MKSVRILLQSLLVVALMCASASAAQTGQRQKPDIPAAVYAIAKSNNAFACDLYSRFKQTKGNLFFSPISISSALAMTYAGAKGETAKQMSAALRFPFAQDELHPAYGAFLGHLSAVQGKGHVQLGIVNSIWPRQGFKLLESYTGLLGNIYKVGITPVDYSLENGEAARREINGWVEKNTNDKIKELIPSGIFTPDTRLTLVNAVYFNGNWRSQFSRTRTQDSPFLTGTGETVQTPFMRQSDSFKHGQHDNLQLLEMPYAGGDLSMLVLLPDEKNPEALEALEKNLSAENLALWRRGMFMREVDVALPKFTITWGTEDLSDHLKALGMQDAFEQAAADFSGMTGSKDLSIQSVLHKAFVDVYEKGTEAAAATGVALRTMRGPSPKPVKFYADHPFLFVIQDNATGAILFMGRMSEPGANDE